jgi:hypothetical protein
MVPLFSIKKSQKKLSTVCPGGFVRSDDRLHQMNQNLRLFHEGVGMMFLVEEVCGGKCLVDKCPSFYLYVAFLVIIHWALGFPQEHLQGSGSLRRKVRVGMGSVGLREVKGVGVPGVSGPHFTAVAVP